MSLITTPEPCTQSPEAFPSTGTRETPRQAGQLSVLQACHSGAASLVLAPPPTPHTPTATCHVSNEAL
ncbi:hypothetical protein E2C01_063644 [Portunus trituberculatus]|uniref:Uncharacterized protein n=1 Tax=Portunus trituberculatus TaxID=210409 RepID=A0A5B7HB05_PORTR|nr:hypothetical protein [Portunus trituberculatus]